MITIKDYRYRTVCDFEGKGFAKHSIGIGNEVDALRKNICTDCLKGVISEGLKRLSDEERQDILSEYIGSVENATEGTKQADTYTELTRKELVDLAKEKSIPGNVNFMSNEKIIEELNKLKAAK